ncbi:MAG: hypothetical protein UY56_C0001G0020 [Parcubacteria group bacterium GW2011_GWA1_50_14]|nr:MAG: hypothetical protein UY56_C0001G0020 [Parcubacteria group bacterium GW2011_GWA1_50_14]
MLAVFVLPSNILRCIITAMNETKPKTTPRDFFLNLLSIVTLYFSATSLGILVVQFINILVPDVLDKVGYGGDPYMAMRFPVASLLVVFPVYVWSARFLEKEHAKTPEKKGVAIHKWLVYLTLFIAALVIIGDLVALVLRFLDGEVTTRFVLKVVAILLIAASVFYYYLAGLRDKKNNFLKFFKFGIVTLVGIVVLSSFFVAGSPAEQKDRRLDSRRVEDLQFIQSEVTYYWQGKNALPENLSLVNDDLRGVRVPVDPETGESYSYRVVEDKVFEICATFLTDSSEYLTEPAYYPYESGSWGHGTGEVCFERTIDPDLHGDRSKPLPL